MPRKTTILSSEPDAGIGGWLTGFLARVGAKTRGTSGGVAGSVDLEAMEYETSDGRTFTIESDNWIALSIEGDGKIVDMAASDFAASVGGKR